MLVQSRLNIYFAGLWMTGVCLSLLTYYASTLVQFLQQPLGVFEVIMGGLNKEALVWFAISTLPFASFAALVLALIYMLMRRVILAFTLLAVGGFGLSVVSSVLHVFALLRS